jgi:hypothetical protein
MVAPKHPDSDLEMFTLLDGEAAEDLQNRWGSQLNSSIG